MRVSKWGNSLAIRLPAAVVKVLKLKEGDQIEVHITSHRELAINRLRQLRRPFPPGFIFDRKDAYER